MNYKNELRQRILSEKKALNPEEIFTSQKYRNLIRTVAREITDTGFENVILSLVPCTDKAGYYDGDNIILYLNNPVTKSFPTIELKNRSIVGFLGHECGHQNYSDMDVRIEYLGNIMDGSWYPMMPDAENHEEAQSLEEMNAYFKRKDKAALMIVGMAAAYIHNILSDEAIEKEMCTRYPGSISMGIRLNRSRNLEQISSLKEQLDQGLENMSIVVNLIAQYTFSGTYNNWEGYQGELLEVLESVKYVVDNAASAENEVRRVMATNQILLKIWTVLSEQIEEVQEAEKENQSEQVDKNSGAEHSGETTEKGETDQSEQTTKNRESDQPAEKSRKEYSGEAAEEKEDLQFGKSTEKNQEKQSEEVTEKDNTNGDGADTQKESPELQKVVEQLRSQIPDFITETGLEKETSAISMLAKGTGSPAEKAGEKESGCNQNNTEQIWNGSDSQTTESQKKAADIEDLFHGIVYEIAKEKANHSLFRDHIREMQRALDILEFSPGHKDVKKVLLRSEHVPDAAIREYENISPVVQKVTRRMHSSLLPVLRKKENRIEHKRLIGRKIDLPNISNRNGKIFQKKHWAGMDSETVVGILIDMSGSMSMNDRIRFAKIAALCVYGFCRTAKIPITIYGHHTDGHRHDWLTKETVYLQSCAEFELNEEDSYRIMQMEAGGANRDGTALIYMGEKLLKRQERQKILILISDGLPNANRYHGREAKEDLKKIKRNLKNKGVTFLAAAIGEDKAAIEEIYQEAFLDISDLERLPAVLSKKLLNLIRRD